MKIKVIGKSHHQGTSKKTGNSYNFNAVHFIGKARGVEGDAAMTANLDGVAYPFDSIRIGQNYNLEYDGNGFVIAFEPVQ